MAFDEIPEAWRKALFAITAYRIAFLGLCRLPGGAEILDELIEAGLVAIWDRDDGRFLTLTPLGAERLGVEIDERGPLNDPRWVPIRYDADGERMEITRPHVQPTQPLMVRMASLDFVPLERREWEQARREKKAKDRERQRAKKMRELKRKAG